MSGPDESGRTSWLRQLRSDLNVIQSYSGIGAGKATKSLTNVEAMTVILEDRRYFQHTGVDLKSLVRELSKILRFKRPGGASTIEMQFVRTVTGRKGRTMSRKFREVILACMVGRRCDKYSVLRSYLSLAYFGTELTGANAAAKKVFGKPADDLDLEDAAFLSAMLCYPRPRAPSAAWTAKVTRRANYGVSIFRADPTRLQHVFAVQNG